MYIGQPIYLPTYPSTILIRSHKMQQYAGIIYCKITLYMFRVSIVPIIRRT